MNHEGLAMANAKQAMRSTKKSPFQKIYDRAMGKFMEKEWAGAAATLYRALYDDKAKNMAHVNNLYWKAAALFIASKGTGKTIEDRKKVIGQFLEYKENGSLVIHKQKISEALTLLENKPSATAQRSPMASNLGRFIGSATNVNSYPCRL